MCRDRCFGLRVGAVGLGVQGLRLGCWDVGFGSVVLSGIRGWGLAGWGRSRALSLEGPSIC